MSAHSRLHVVVHRNRSAADVRGHAVEDLEEDVVVDRGRRPFHLPLLVAGAIDRLGFFVGLCEQGRFPHVSFIVPL
jgi:hypothetical protein